MPQRYEVPEGETLVIDGPCRVDVIGDPGKKPVTGPPVKAGEEKQPAQPTE